LSIIYASCNINYSCSTNCVQYKPSSTVSYSEYADCCEYYVGLC